MKEVTGYEDFSTPIIVLFMFAMLFSFEAKEILDYMLSGRTSLVSEPVIFTGNITGTMARLSWYLMPLILLIAAIKEKVIILKISYFLGIVPLVLTNPLIEKIGFSPLYILKLFLLFFVAVCMMRYLLKISDLYKERIRKQIR